jgi:hypothetical protein
MDHDISVQRELMLCDDDLWVGLYGYISIGSGSCSILVYESNLGWRCMDFVCFYLHMVVLTRRHGSGKGGRLNMRSTLLLEFYILWVGYPFSHVIEVVQDYLSYFHRV